MMLQPHGGAAPHRPPVSSPNLRVTWYENWGPELDEALTVLPEMRDCSHDLYRSLARNRIASPKRYALVAEEETPVAAIALRQYQRHWEPVTMWLLPGVFFPAAPGYLGPALAALNVPVDAFWWRMSTPPPDHPAIRDLRAIPVYGMSLSEDFEKFWKHSGLWRNVRHNRNLCRDFTFSVDSKGAAEWVVRKWAEKWSSENPHILDHLEDRVLVANYLAERGRYHTVLCQDKGETVAGASVIVHGRDLVASVNYRNTDYDRYGVMSRVNDYVFNWGAEAGFNAFEIGGGPEYKQKWAPRLGERHYFSICPRPQYFLRRMLQLFTKAREKVQAGMGG
jgi:hypothetical protein